MKRIIVALIILLALSGCSSADKRKMVAIDGSTSMEKVIGFLSEVYMEKNPDVKITYNPTGSGAGINAALQERCDIGLSSRDLNDGEKQTLAGTKIAIDGIAVIVNKKNRTDDLSVEQIAKIFTGEITNWSEIGGDDAPIVLIGREAASGTRDGFETVTDTVGRCKYNQELTSTGDVVGAVSGNPNTIGYTSVESVKGTVKVLTVEGVNPETESIQSGEYKLQRDFIFVTRKGTPLSDTAQEFFDFAVSDEADKWIIRAGAVPVLK